MSCLYTPDPIVHRFQRSTATHLLLSLLQVYTFPIHLYSSLKFLMKISIVFFVPRRQNVARETFLKFYLWLSAHFLRSYTWKNIFLTKFFSFLIEIHLYIDRIDFGFFLNNCKKIVTNK